MNAAHELIHHAAREKCHPRRRFAAVGGKYVWRVFEECGFGNVRLHRFQFAQSFGQQFEDAQFLRECAQVRCVGWKRTARVSAERISGRGKICLKKNVRSARTKIPGGRARSSASRVCSRICPYWTPDGQAVSQARHSRHKSRCLVICELRRQRSVAQAAHNAEVARRIVLVAQLAVCGASAEA